MKVSEAKLSLLGKARARPDQVRKVVDSVVQLGPTAAYKKAATGSIRTRRWDTPCADSSLTLGPAAEEFTVGQMVACAGNEHALHAEVNWVPCNLCVPVPEAVDPRLASFATVGAIAMHGVRRGEVQLGETACVVGLGLVGQLVVQLLVAAGVRVVGIDPVEARCRARRSVGSGCMCAAVGRRRRRSGACPFGPLGGPRRRSHLPRRRRLLERAGADGCSPCARSGPSRRHRQVSPRPSVERVLRERARIPFLTLVRSRPLRRSLRARRHRLSGRLRALDRASQSGVLPRSGRSKRAGARSLGIGRLSGNRRRRRVRPPEFRRHARSRLPVRVPARFGSRLARGARRPRPARRATSLPARLRGLAGRSGRLPGRRQLCVVDAASTLGSLGSGGARSRRDDDVPVGDQCSTQVRLWCCLDSTRQPCSTTSRSTRCSS